MIKISKDNINSFMASIVDTHDKEKYTEEFWDHIDKENSDLLDFVLGFVSALEDDNDRTMFLDGLWIMYSLVQRELELNDLETLNI